MQTVLRNYADNHAGTTLHTQYNLLGIDGTMTNRASRPNPYVKNFNETY